MTDLKEKAIGCNRGAFLPDFHPSQITGCLGYNCSPLDLLLNKTGESSVVRASTVLVHVGQRQALLGDLGGALDLRVVGGVVLEAPTTIILS